MTETPENSNDLPATDESLEQSVAVENISVEIAEVSPDPKPEPQPKPAPTKPAASTSKRRPSPAGQTVSGDAVDIVRLSACVYKNKFARRSMSVYHVQRRLNELGYRDAYTDKTGWYGDLTMKSVREYQATNTLAGEGVIDRATLDHLFSDDPNVTVVD